MTTTAQAVADCPWCHHARRTVDLLREGDGLAIEHVPSWRGRQCPGPSFRDVFGAADAVPEPTDYAVGYATGWREAIEVVQRRLTAVRAEPRTDRTSKATAIGQLLAELIEAGPR